MEFYGRRRPGEEEGKTVTDGYNESTYAACSKHMSRWKPFIPCNWFSQTTKEAFCTGKFYWVYSDFLCDVRWPCLWWLWFLVQICCVLLSAPHYLLHRSHSFTSLWKFKKKKILDPFLDTMTDHQGLCCLSSSCGEELVWDRRCIWPALVRILRQGTWTHSLLALSQPVTLCHKELLSIRNRATATEEHKFNLMNSI